MVPEGWRQASVDDCIKFQGGTQPPKNVFQYKPGPGLVRLIQTRDFRTDKFATYIPLKYVKNSFAEDDIMIGRYGPPIFQIFRGLSGAYNVALIKATPKEGVDKDFAFYFLKQEKLFRELDALSRRSAGQAGIEMDFLKSFPMPLPPLTEQKRIAEVLGVWDRAIEVAGKQLDLARTQKRALMQTLLTPTRRFPGYEGQPWPMRPIGEVATEVSERNKDDDAYPVISCTKTVGFVNSLEYFKKQVFSDDLSGYKVIRRNQLGYPSNHVEEGSIGLQNLHDAALVSPIYTVFEPSRGLDPRFLIRVLKTDRYRQIFAAATNASVDRRGSLRWKAFATIKVPVPTREEQDLINEAGDCADAEIDALANNLTRLQAEKKALMQQLLTGQKRLAV